ncbi:MAG: fimbrial biogenesis chaperone [Armatimonadota bacterium]
MYKRITYIVALIALCVGASPSWALKCHAALDPIIVAVKPGSVINRTFTLTLAVDEQQTHFKLHIEDWWRSEDGKQSFYKEPGTVVPRSCGRWITVDPVEPQIEPGQTLTARVSITVPSDAKTGGYWCALTVDEVPNPDAVKPEGVGIMFNASISVPIFVFISPIDRSAKFLDLQVNGESASVKLRNTGDCPLLTTGRFEFIRPGEKTPAAVVPFSGALFLSPVDTRIFTVALPPIGKLPSGRYIVRVVLDIGIDRFLGVQKEIDVKRTQPKE